TLPQRVKSSFWGSTGFKSLAVADCHRRQSGGQNKDPQIIRRAPPDIDLVLVLLVYPSWKTQSATAERRWPRRRASETAPQSGGNDIKTGVRRRGWSLSRLTRRPPSGEALRLRLADLVSDDRLDRRWAVPGAA